MTHLAANLEALRRRDADLAARVEAAAPALEVVPARSGAPTARRGAAWVHSSRDPAREAARLLEAEDLRGVQAAALLGLGLGYPLEALAARLPGRPVAVCVAEAGEVRSALEARDLRPLLDDPRIGWVVGGDAAEVRRRLEAALAPTECAFVRAVPFRPSVEAAPAFYRLAVAEVGRIAGLHKVSLAALAAFGPLWTSNAVRNLPFLARADSVSTLAGAWRGRPAAIVAAGPSLDEALPSLARRRGGLVVAVDTALGPCLAAGVRPDLVVAADAQPENLRDFDGLDVRGLDLVATHVVDPRTFALPWRRVHGAVLDDPLGRWTAEAAGGLGSLRTGGSVATLAFDLARRSGASNVVLVGLDLSWSGRTHARGASHEAAAAESAGRFATVETLRRRGGGRRVRARDGEEVETSEALAAYATWIESEAAAPGAPGVVVVGRSILAAGRSARPDEIPALLGGEAWRPPPPRAAAATDPRGRLDSLRRDALAGLAALDAARDLFRESGGRLRVEDAAASAAAEALRELAARPPLDPVVRAAVAPVLDRLDGRAPPDADVIRAGERVAAGLRTVLAALDDVGAAP